MDDEEAEKLNGLAVPVSKLLSAMTGLTGA
jgi:hypothetical protein